MSLLRRSIFTVLLAPLVGGTSGGCSAGAVDQTAAEEPEGRVAEAMYGPNIANTPGPFEQAVVRISMAGSFCSGTIVSPTGILTAAHCFCQGGPTSVTTQTGATLVPLSNPAVHPNFKCNTNSNPNPDRTWAYDMAIVRLANPLPPGIVSKFPPIHLGDAVGDVKAGVVKNIRQAGAGRQGPFECQPSTTTAVNGPACNTGKLELPACTGPLAFRWGNVNNVVGEDDDCDSIFGEGSFAEGTCWDRPILRSHISDALAPTTTVHAPGDSGGPLYGDVPGYGTAILGVTSGWYVDCTPYYKDQHLQQFWAPVGSEVAGFLQNALIELQDNDGDGIVDAQDNCPPSRCKNPLDCANADQKDDDLDGIGDKCDNCKPSQCGVGTAFDSCFNPDQADADGDKTGDVCDLCPASPVAQENTDGDRWGNDCDNCPTVASSDQSDADGDGIGDACDACLTIPNPAKDLTNSNALAEAQAGAVALPDVCDPAPVLRLSAPEYPTVGAFDVVEPETYPTVSFGTRPFLGKQFAPDSKSFSGTQKFRVCRCVGANGSPLSAEQCLTLACPPVEPVATPSIWKTMSLTAASGAPVGAEGALAAFSTSNASPTAQFTWNWLADTQAGVIGPPILQGNPALDAPTLPAAIAVEASTPPYSSTPREDLNNLRDTYLRVDAGAYRRKDPPSLGPLEIENECLGFGCIEWLDPHFLIDDPFLAVDPAIHDPGLIVTLPGGGIALVAGPSGVLGPVKGFDLTSAGLSDSLRADLVGSHRARLWVPPVESGRERRARGELRQAAVLPRTFTPDVVPATIVGQPGGFRYAEERPRGLQQAAEAAGVSIESPVALFSTTLNGLLLVGGQAGDSLSTGIWRYDLGEGRSWELGVRGAFPSPHGRVLSAALDPLTMTLYVLEVEDGIKRTSIGKVALRSYDIFHETTRKLGEWPYTGKADAVYLNRLEDGQLAVTIRTKALSSVVRLKVVGNHVVVSGFHALPGKVYSAPVLGDTDLVVPVTKGSKFALLKVPGTAFLPGGACDF